MEMSLIKLKEFGARHLVVIALVLLVVMEIASLAFVDGVRLNESPSVQPQPTLKISDIRGSRIDDQAAMIVIDKSATVSETLKVACSTLPINVWIFLLIAYVALLVFNFSYTFKQVTEPQWFWETLYTVLALVGWYSLDDCRAHIWFPLAVVKFGLIIFIVYLYLLEKKPSELEIAKEEKTESMF
jgi:hypothetical protein